MKACGSFSATPERCGSACSCPGHRSGIGFNATSTIIHGGFTSGPTTKNWTHTTSGLDRLLVLFADIWQDVGGTGTITSATYKGSKGATDRILIRWT